VPIGDEQHGERPKIGARTVVQNKAPCAVYSMQIESAKRAAQEDGAAAGDHR
jgi:hypothetical protein